MKSYLCSNFLKIKNTSYLLIHILAALLFPLLLFFYCRISISMVMLLYSINYFNYYIYSFIENYWYKCISQTTYFE